MNRCLLILFLIISSYNILTGQGINAYVDYRDYLIVFDNGSFKELETHPVKSFKIGKKYVAYEDNVGNFKVYYHGETHQLLTAIEEYYVTNDFVLAKLNNQLKVFENGIETNLTVSAGSFLYGESLVAFNDNKKQLFRVYYKNKIHDLEDIMGNNHVKQFRLKHNVLVYVDSHNYLKVFHEGRLKDFPPGVVSEYKVGQNLVVYYDSDNMEFKLWHNGIMYDLDTYRPSSYLTGKNIVAYVDNSGYFKAFNNGEIYEISDFEPDYYKVLDNLIVYEEQGYFKVNFEGSNYTLENYVPQSYIVHNNSLAYIDDSRKLKLFKTGITTKISDSYINEFRLVGETIWYLENQKKNKIYFNENTFE